MPGRAVPPSSAVETVPVPAPATLERLVQVLTALPGRGDDVRAVVNGLFGDALEAQDSALATPMTLRTAAGAELPLERGALDAALPDAGPRLCVFVHGLMSTESVWRFPRRELVTYGELLARDRGVTPVYVRYNTGRHISANGRSLAALLQQLLHAWPVRVREIDLVGHSMGGLVLRSACHYGRGVAPMRDRVRGRGPWPAKVRRVVLLGVPNTGANLEVIANLTSAALWAVPTPVTRLLGAGLDRRSDGIKDLRWGAVLDEDWIEVDPDATVRRELAPVEAPRRAAYLVIAGSLISAKPAVADPAGADSDPAGAEPTGGSHPLDRLLGDALVTSASAEGRLADATSALVPNATVRRCPGVAHIALAARPEVYDEIVDWWR